MPTLYEVITGTKPGPKPPPIPKTDNGREQARDMIEDGTIRPADHVPKGPRAMRQMSMVQPRIGALAEFINSFQGCDL